MVSVCRHFLGKHEKTVAFFKGLCYTKTVCESNLTANRGGVFLNTNQPVSAQFEQLAALVGNTPLLDITLEYRGEVRHVYAKAEYYNLSGSIKDRVAYYILKKAYETGAIHKGDYIAEATSGNTGIAFSAMGAALGNPVVIYMPDWMSTERRNLIRSYGAEVRLVSAEQGGFLGSIAMSEEFGKQNGVFLPRQFSNEDNAEAHFETTGAEIIEQLAKIGKVADAVVAGVGTGGTVMGIGRKLRTVNLSCGLFPLEPLNSPTLSTGTKVGKHRIQGISDEFIPPIMKLEEATGIVSIDDIDSIRMAQMLSRQFGLGVGISSGANLLGCLQAGDRIGGDKTIVTVFADDNKKYLSTDYCEEFPVTDDCMTAQIKLLDLKAWL